MITYVASRPDILVVAGCGGIGARIAAVIPRLEIFPFTHVWFVDPDRVEARNLRRQHFGADDVGRPKAEVLAARYARPHSETSAYVAKAEQVIAAARPGRLLVITAVDSRSARRAIMAACRQTTPAHAVIDVACGHTWGHLTYSGFGTMYTSTSSRATTIVGALATPDIYDPEVPDDPAPSCGDDHEDEQTTVLNVAAAAHTTALLQAIATEQLLATCAWTFGPLSLRALPVKLSNRLHIVPAPITEHRPSADYPVYGGVGTEVLKEVA